MATVPDLPSFLVALTRQFPNLTVVPIPMRDVESFLTGHGEPVMRCV